MDKSEKFWDRQADGYGRDHENMQITGNKDFITTVKYLDNDSTVMDYGCGSGIVACEIADRAKEVYAVDVSSAMVEVSKANALKRGIENINCVHANIFDDRFRKEQFDVILAFRVLHVLDKVEAVIRRINELLKPGGVFISVTACLGSQKLLFGPVVFLGRALRLLPIRINFFKLPELRELLTSGGFQVLEYERMDDRFPHYCIVARKV